MAKLRLKKWQAARASSRWDFESLILLGWIPVVLGLLACTPSSGEDLVLLRARAASAATLGRPDWQRTYLLRALEADPDNADDWASVGDASLAGFEGSVNQAIEAYQKCLSLDPNHHEARLQLAKALILKGDGKQCLAVLKNAGEAAEVLSLRAEALYTSDPTGAWPIVVQAIERAEPSEKPYLLAAKIAQATGDWKAMAEMALAARARFPFDPSAAYMSVVAEGRLGDAAAQEQAQHHFQLLMEYRDLPADAPQTSLQKLAILDRLEPDWIGSKTNLKTAELFFQLKSGQRNEALAIWNEYGDAISALPADEKRQLIKSFIELGWISQARQLLEGPQGQATEAFLLLRAELDFQEQHFDRVVTAMNARIDRGDGLAPHYFYRAKALLWLGDETRAIEDFQMAVTLAPWFARYRLELAKLKLANGDSKAAAELLKAHPVANDPSIVGFMKETGLGEGSP